MACQKVCKQVRNDVKVKPHPYIFFTLHCTVVGKRCRDGQGFVYYLHVSILQNRPCEGCIWALKIMFM